MLRAITLSLLFALLPSHAAADPSADLSSLRSAMAQVRADLRSVVLVADQEMTVERNGQPLGPPMASTFRLVFQDPDQVRLESRGDRMGGSLTVYDGTTTTVYVDQLRQFTRFQGAPNLSQSGAGGDGSPQALRDAILDRIVPLLPDDAELLREESREVDGIAVPCAVVQHGIPGVGPEAEGTVTLWIDIERGVVLLGQVDAPREIAPGTRAQTRSSLTVTSVALDIEPEPGTFGFVAPDGAQQVDRFTAGPSRSSFKGREAPDFELTDLDGKTHRLSDLRGKVVLLDFWATWCGPCKIELPHVETLRKEFEDDGLVVLAISSEPAEKSRRYLTEQGYGFTNLVDEGSQVMLAYQASSIPVTIIVDREGMVVEHWVGAQMEATLRRGLAAAGLE